LNSVDRLPPNDSSIEQAVIGCCLLSPRECLSECIEKLKSDSFYDLRHQTVFDVMVRMSERMEPIDVMTVQKILNDMNLLEQIGGIAYLSWLQDSVPSVANLPYYLEKIIEKHLLRRMISTCTETVGKVYDNQGDAARLLDEFERDALSIRPQKIDDTGIKTLLGEAAGMIEQKCLSTGAITGLSTGLHDLDRLTDGMHKAEMIIVAALPSRGKTALAVNMAVFNALQGIPVAIFSAEMRPVQLVVRSICSESRVNFKTIDARDVPKMTVTMGRLSKAPLFIERASGFSISQLRAAARRLKQKHGIQMIVVDYIQLLSGTGDNKEQEVSSISKGLKALAMELEVPVVALSQINDKGETKYARALSEDTDSLWKLDNDGEWQTHVQPVKLNVEKSRDGETGTVNLTLMKEYTRFESAARVSDEDVP
jgi:replicative DNA helicase